jgi:hypothetical protein
MSKEEIVGEREKNVTSIKCINTGSGSPWSSLVVLPGSIELLGEAVNFKLTTRVISNGSHQLLHQQKVEGKLNWKGKSKGPHQTQGPML